jgi:hypothetical protein
MKIIQRLLIVLTLMCLATGTAWSGGKNGNNGRGNDGCRGRSCNSNGNGNGGKMPEMDAASGGSAIALLTGMVLLMKERKRSKRSSDSDE